MKKILLLVTLFAVAVIFAVACAKTGTVAENGNFAQSIVDSFGKGANADYLAGLHMKEGMECTDCHGDDATISDDLTAINGACEDCHADMHGMAELSAEQYPDRMNAHESHLTNISCTVCHTGHEASYPYCLNCHTFDDMRISYESGYKMNFAVENFDVYDDVTPNHIEDTDVVVIGSGGAGFVAALNAMQNGRNVILLEKMPISGGNSQLAAGGMNVPGTEYQRAAGVMEDSPDVMFADTMKGGRNLNDPELVRILSDRSYESLKWIESIGGKLNNLSFSGGQSYKRVHTAEGGTLVGAYLITTFHENAKRLGMDIRVNSKAVKLLTDNKGAVTGVRVHSTYSGTYDIKAKAVVLATGGFGANNAMVASFRPELYGTTTSNQPGALGDGIIIAQKIGADLTDINEIQIHPTVALNTKILVSESVRGKGAIMVNKEGNRFVNEMLTRDKTSAAVLAQPGKSAYVIFDEAIYQGWKQIDGYFKLGLVKQGSNPAELAKVLGIPADNFDKTMKRWNQAVKNKKDTDFERKDLDVSLDHGMLYAIEIAPGIHHTMGGVKINTNTQVISVNGKPIPGLYAAGEVTGGVHGGNRLGGNAIADIVTFGRIAGINAAEYAK